MKDIIVFNFIEKELCCQQYGIELIVFENFMSLQVMEVVGSVLINKYVEGYFGKCYYGGCEVVDEIEQLVIDWFKEFFGVVYVNVQFYFGVQANVVVFLVVL